MYNNYQEDSSKSKRISWLSIFSSLCNAHGQTITPDKLQAEAYKLNDDLYEKYPYLEQPTQSKPYMQNNSPKQKPSKCPTCGNFSVFHNKGISKKSGTEYENYKCSKCDYINWISTTYNQKMEAEDAKRQSNIDDLSEERFKDELPHEYGG